MPGQQLEAIEEIDQTYLDEMSLSDGRIGDFCINEQGVFYIAVVKGEEIPIYVCQPLMVTAMTSDNTNDNWGKVVEFTGPMGDRIQEHFLYAELMTPKPTVERLAKKGLRYASHPRTVNLIAQYLRTARSGVKLLSSIRPGWTSTSFVLSNGKSYGKDEIIYTGQYPEPPYGKAGNWKEKVGKLCAGNSRLVLAVSAAFAGPLLELADMVEGGGFHLRGESSIGKSTVQEVACSVYGDWKNYGRDWDATKGSFEAVAEAHSDHLLVLDEIGKADPSTIGDSIYMLASGTGKARMKEKTKKWRILSLSSGEITLEEQMRKANKTPMNGQQVRLLDILAEVVPGKTHNGQRMGVFENLHHFPDSRAMAEYFKPATRQNYGVFPEYLTAITTHLEATRKAVSQIVDGFRALVTPEKSSGEVSRAIGRFAIVAAGGEIATSFGITGWKKGEAVEAARKCFLVWYEYFKTYNPHAMAAARVRTFIAENVARFQELGFDKTTVKDKIGYHKKGAFILMPDVFREVVCAGLNPDVIAKSLEQQGYLVTSGSNRLLYRQRLTGQEKAEWTYCVNESILEA